MRNHFYDLPEVLQQKILHSKAKQEARDVVQATDISMLIGFVNLGTQRQRQIAAWKLWGLGHVGVWMGSTVGGWVHIGLRSVHIGSKIEDAFLG